jgi:hypothetical protein
MPHGYNLRFLGAHARVENHEPVGGRMEHTPKCGSRIRDRRDGSTQLPLRRHPAPTARSNPRCR